MKKRTKEEKRKLILDTFSEINEINKKATWNLLYQIALQVTGFVEKYKYREDTQDLIDTNKR